MKFKFRGLRKIMNSINNVSIKKKLISIYIFCVLIPLLFINTIFYLFISHSVKMQELTILNQSMDRIVYDIATDIEQCMGVYRTINLDNKLYAALNEKYLNSEDYYDIYHNYMEEAIGKFIPIYKQIQDISIYTGNNTIIESKYYHFLNNGVLDSQWYKKFQEANRSTTINAYLNKDLNEINGDRRNLSIINKLYNYKEVNSTNNIVKIDINLRSLLDIVNNEKTDGVFYLIDNDNKVVFSNNEEIYNNTKKFEALPLNYFTQKDIVITNKFGATSYMKDWRLVGVFHEKNISKSVRNSKNTVILVALLSLIVATLAILIMAYSIKDRLEIVSKYLKDVSNKKFNLIEIEAGGDEIGTLINEYNNSTIKIKNLIEEVYESEIEKAKAEIKSLQNQVNPHFLYNTLNTVRLRCVLKGENETADIIKYMAKSFRRLLAWKEDLVTIREEIEFAKDFLEIQKYRYGDMLDYDINVEPTTFEYKIPKMCIQALVENSSVHGIEMTDKPGKISVIISIDDKNLYCKVEDNGIGIEEEKLKLIRLALKSSSNINDSYAIYNIYKRLKLYFGESVIFNINSEIRKGTIVDFIIPIKEEENYV